MNVKVVRERSVNIKIKSEIYNEILFATPAPPPECGGIIGGKDNVITHFCPDIFGKNEDMSYEPDVNYLNDTIKRWANDGICFYGVYHSHLEKGVCLSEADKKYIKSIMLSCATITDTLYFPIVLPSDKIIFYKAKEKDNKVTISREIVTAII